MTIPFQGIRDLKTVFKDLSVQRLSWLFLHRESLTVAKLLGVEGVQRYRTEKAKIAVIKQHVLTNGVPDEPPRCNCNEPPTGRRWMRADFDGSKPIAYYIDPSVPQRFHERIRSAFNRLEQEGKRLRFIELATPSGMEVHVKYGPYDGPGRTLGVTISWDDGTDDLDVGRPIEVLIDEAEVTLWSDLSAFETVFVHEGGHVIGIGHAPDDADQEQNVFAAFFHGVFLRFGSWDKLAIHSRYGDPDKDDPTFS